MYNFSDSILILGDGAWGTTLAVLLSQKISLVKIWGPSPENLQIISKFRENKKYLPGIVLPDNVAVEASLKDAAASVSLIILAIPSRFVMDLFLTLKETKAFLSRYWCIATKGIDFKNYKRMSELIAEQLSPKKLAVLSGPAIAREVVLGLPTALVVASKDKIFANELQHLFATDYLRIYRSDDIVGVELGGSLKNIIAIAAGICDGLSIGINAKSALLTRGISEMCRFAKRFGANPQTIYGVSGLGDLMTTAFSPFSRNRTFGEAIGRGAKPADLLKTTSKAIEGAYTVRAVVKMAEDLGIDMPISREVYNIVFLSKSPKEALLTLMDRPLKAED